MNVPAFSRYLTSLRSSDNEDQLLNAICQVPRELLPFDACFLVLIDEEAGVPPSYPNLWVWGTLSGRSDH